MTEATEVQMVNGVPVVYQNLGLYEGPIPVMLNKLEDPLLKWRGAKIPKELWEQVVSFMVWTYDKHRSESQVRLFYNEEQSKWAIVVLPQSLDGGMASKEFPDHEDREAAFADVDPSEGWREAGTIHHHCAGGAFQSGTDWNDEKDKNGLHLTLGDMEQKKLHSLHARASFRKVMYIVNINQWLESEVLVDPEKKHGPKLKVRNSKRHFPNIWKQRMVPKPKYVYASSYTSKPQHWVSGKGWVDGPRPNNGSGRSRTRYNGSSSQASMPYGGHGWSGKGHQLDSTGDEIPRIRIIPKDEPAAKAETARESLKRTQTEFDFEQLDDDKYLGAEVDEYRVVATCLEQWDEKLNVTFRTQSGWRYNEYISGLARIVEAVEDLEKLRFQQKDILHDALTCIMEKLPINLANVSGMEQCLLDLYNAGFSKYLLDKRIQTISREREAKEAEEAATKQRELTARTKADAKRRTKEVGGRKKDATSLVSRGGSKGLALKSANTQGCA